jgi:hypothetical protein
MIHGSERGDGVYELVKAHNFRYMRSIGMIGIRGSRNHAPQRWNIDAAAAALREAGFTVEIDLDYEAQPAAVVAQQRAEQNENRIDALERKAGSYIGAGNAIVNQVHEQRSLLPLGQPNIVQANGRVPLRAQREKWNNRDRRGWALIDKGTAAANRAQAAAANQAHHLAGDATMRRIAKREAELRGVDESLTKLGDRQTGYRPRLEARRRELAGLLEWDRDHLAKLGETMQYRQWGPEDFTAGDFARCSGYWVPVHKVNKKSLTHPHWAAGTDTSPWDRVSGQRSLTEHLEALADELTHLEPVHLSTDLHTALLSQGWAGTADQLDEGTRELWPAEHWAIVNGPVHPLYLRPVIVAPPPADEPPLQVTELTAEEYQRRSRNGHAGKLGPLLTEARAMWLRRGATHHALERGGVWGPVVIKKGT